MLDVVKELIEKWDSMTVAERNRNADSLTEIEREALTEVGYVFITVGDGEFIVDKNQ